MKIDPQCPNDELYGNSQAAQFLSQQLSDRTPDQWELWLRNNRNVSRHVPYRIDVVHISNRSFYRPQDLAKFIEWEKSRRLGVLKLSGRAAEAMLAYGIGTATGSTTGRKLEVIGVHEQTDQVTKERYVQLITGNPFRVYRLDLDQARDIATQLLHAVGLPSW
ncbi:hypothetical protein [Rhodoferax ferrireducens]|uniref:hypothetical protein n=1 Tax=Rhodoferax ferrireducens TaxID=192843 RepID=UPI003BB60199